MSFESDFISAEIKKLSEDDFNKWTKIFLDDILNAKIKEEFIRVPLIGRYLKFHQVSYTDYSSLLKSNANLLSEKDTLYIFTELDIDLHFKDFVREYGRRNSGIELLFDEDFLIQLTDTSIYHYAPLDTHKFVSLLQVKNHLALRIQERFELIKKSLKLQHLGIDIIFCLPQSQYSMNKNNMKLILELTF